MTRLNPQLIPAIFEDVGHDKSSRMMEALSPGSTSLTVLVRLQQLHDTGNLNPEGIKKLANNIGVPRISELLVRAKGIENAPDIFRTVTGKKVSQILFGTERPALSEVRTYSYLLSRKLGVNMFASLINTTINGDCGKPISILEEYFHTEFIGLLNQFESLKRTNKAFIRIPEGINGTEKFDKSLAFINRFIDSSILELRTIITQLSGYTRRPLVLYALLKRIRREYAFINTDRGELRDKVALTIKNSRTRSSNLPLITPSREQSNAISLPQEGMIDRLAQIEARLKNIRKKLSTGMVMKILSNSSNTKLYDDLEEIYERLTIIDLQFPDYTYRVNALKEEINSIRGFQSALVQEKTSTTIANVVGDTGKKNNDIPHVLDDYEEQAIAYIEKLLLDTRRVSSTRDNDHTGKNSKGDGSFRQDVISPLFRALISNIKRGTVSPQAFSWSDVIKASGDMHIKHGIWIVIKPVLMKLEETGDLETNMRIIVDTFPEFSETCGLPLNILKAALEEYISNNSPIMVGA